MSIVWTEEKLKNLHYCLLQIILEVDRVCKKHGIMYFLGGGTLLGAVRNGGFLPWDEDADLMMKREDYDRFIDAAQKEMNEDFFLQTHSSDTHSHRPYVRVRLNGTVMATEFSAKYPESHQGIFVDIFCHDKTANTRIFQKMHIWETVILNSLVFRKWENMSEKNTQKGWKNIISGLFSINTLEKRQENTYKKFSRKNSKTFLYDGMGKHLKRGGFPKKWLDSEKELSFEGHMLPVPIEYGSYLEWLYGDYKTPPEKENQVPAANIVQLDFGKWRSNTNGG